MAAVIVKRGKRPMRPVAPLHRTIHDESVAMRLWDQLTEPGEPDNLLYTYEDGRFVAGSWADCVAEAHDKAAGLREIGVADGERVACVLTNSRAVCTSVLGIWLAGGTVVSLPVPGRGMAIPDYVAQLRRLCAHVEARLLLTEQRFSTALDLGPDADLEAVAFEKLPTGRKATSTPPADESVAFIQFSSGTTGEPRGCMLTAAAIGTQLEALANRTGIDARADRVVSWLPLSHDMGFFGCLLLPWATGAQLTLGTPERFLTSPRTWAQDCADVKATLTAGPSFGIKIAARAAAVTPPEGPLDLRCWIVGSDRIEWTALQSVIGELGSSGLRAGALTPAYGLAEATLAVTMATPGSALRSLSVDAQALLAGEVREVPADARGATRLVSSGEILAGSEVRIDRESSLAEFGGSGAGPADGAVAIGEICVRSASLAAGYYGDPKRTGERFRDGELRTGDFGFLDSGQLFVIGRSDDMLSAGGRNIHASELEALFMQEPGVKPGGCALVDVTGADEGRIVCLVETSDGVTDLDALAESLRRTAATQAGLRLDECAFLARGTLPKTPSGKVQRFRCRQLAAGENEGVVERVSLDSTR